MTDEAIVEASRRLWREHRLAVEHGAAAALAGLDLVEDPGTAVVVLCGANTDPATLQAEPAHAAG